MQLIWFQLHALGPTGAPLQHDDEPPPRSWEIGAPFYIPLRPGGRSRRCLSLIRKSLTIDGWEDIAAESQLPSKLFPQARWIEVRCCS